MHLLRHLDSFKIYIIVLVFAHVITIDLNNNSLHLDLNEELIKNRKKELQYNNISVIPKIKKGYLSKYRKLVGDLSTGFSTI